MNRGCLSLGEIQCDECHRTIPHSQRYVAISEGDSVGAEQEQTARYCLECALQKGYAYYKEEKGEKIVTVFPISEYQPPIPE